MSRKLNLGQSFIALAYFTLFAIVGIFFHHRAALESYYLALAQTMQTSGFSFIANWQQIPLIHLPPVWVWFNELNALILPNHLILLKCWSGFMTLWSCYLTMRLMRTLLPQTAPPGMLNNNISIPLCALMMLMVIPATAWFTLGATPWPTVTATTLTAIYASLAYSQRKQAKFYWAFWASIWITTLSAGLLFALPLIALTLCWPNTSVTRKLLTSVRGWVIWLLIYGAWVYAAYRAAGLIVFSHMNVLWWLIPSHGAFSAYNPFLPNALTGPTTMPSWLAIITLLPPLMILPNAVAWWKQAQPQSRLYAGILCLALVELVLICGTQTMPNATNAMQLIAPLLAIITAPYLAWLLNNHSRYISAATHFSSLFIALILLVAIAFPRFHSLLPMINIPMRLALIAIILVIYIPLLIARWISLRVATIVWLSLLILGLFGSLAMQYHYQQQQSLTPLFKQVKHVAAPGDVIANMGQLRPELWLALQRRIVQISPLSAQVSVPANPLLVDPQQFILAMRANGRKAWIFIDTDDLESHPQFLSIYQPQAQAGDVWLLTQIKES